MFTGTADLKRLCTCAAHFLSSSDHCGVHTDACHLCVFLLLLLLLLFYNQQCQFCRSVFLVHPAVFTHCFRQMAQCIMCMLLSIINCLAYLFLQQGVGTLCPSLSATLKHTPHSITAENPSILLNLAVIPCRVLQICSKNVSSVRIYSFQCSFLYLYSGDMSMVSLFSYLIIIWQPIGLLHVRTFVVLAMLSKMLLFCACFMF